MGGSFTYIQTLHGVGYRFLTTPRRMPSPSAMSGFHEASAPGMPLT